MNPLKHFISYAKTKIRRDTHYVTELVTEIWHVALPISHYV